MSSRGETDGCAAAVARATTRCRCGRFGVRTSGYCSQECADEFGASAPETAVAPAPPKPVAVPPAALVPARASVLVTAPSEAAEEAATVARIAAMANGSAPGAGAADGDPEVAAFVARMVALDEAILREQAQRRARGGAQCGT